jgi:arginase
MAARAGHRSRPIDLIGVPFNSSGTTDGVARAPSALRAGALVDAIRAAGLEIRDHGDLELEPPVPTRDPASGLIAPVALIAMIRTVRATVEASLRDGGFPLVLGGDCPILLGCLGAPALGDACLVFVDGHEDAWPPLASTTGEAADMELGFLLRLAVDTLPADLVAELPRLEPRRVTVIGARDAAELAEAGIPSIDRQVEIIRPGSVDPATADRLGADTVRRLARAGRPWLHVDLDVLGTSSLAAVDYQQPGGIDWATLLNLSQGALADGAVAGWTVTIYNPDLDPDRSGARAIVRYLVDALGG